MTDMFRLPSRQGLTLSVQSWRALTRQHRLEMGIRVRPVLSPVGAALEVGPHARQFIKLFAAMIPNGRAHDIERGSCALSILRIVELYKRLSSITDHAYGLGDSLKPSVLNVPTKEPDSVGIGLSFVGDFQALERRTDTEDVTVKRLDEVVMEYAIPSFDSIKGGLKGPKVGMLIGAGEALSWLSPAIFIERVKGNLAGHADCVETVTGFLGDLGYRPAGAPAPWKVIRCLQGPLRDPLQSATAEPMSKQ